MKRTLLATVILCLALVAPVTSGIASEFLTKEQIIESLVGRTIKYDTWVEQFLPGGVSKVDYAGVKFDGAWTVENQGNKAAMCFTYDRKHRDSNGCYAVSIKGNSVTWHSIKSGKVLYTTNFTK